LLLVSSLLLPGSVRNTNLAAAAAAAATTRSGARMPFYYLHAPL